MSVPFYSLQTSIRISAVIKCLCCVAVIGLIAGNLRLSPSRASRVLRPNDTSTATDISVSLQKHTHLSTFYILPTPEVTDWLLGNFSDDGYRYYERALNEDQAELWLYRGLQRHPSRVMDPLQADVFVICGCLHWNYRLNRLSQHKHDMDGMEGATSITPIIELFDAKSFANALLERIVDKDKPHLLAIPTTNPGTGRYIGLKAIVKALTKGGVHNLWSLGFERNKFWQRLPPERIIPIPYVVRPPIRDEQTLSPMQGSVHSSLRESDFVFYVGDSRPHAKEWGGCDRSMVAPLALESNTHIRLIDSRQEDSESTNSTNRMTQDEYNQRMASSEYCLVVCGDSPTSRSLSSAMVHGCIPLRVGSRLRGLCEPPCHKGWGWTISGSENPHLPFGEQLDWTLFPEMNEALFQQNPAQVVHETLAGISIQEREQLRLIMQQHRQGFVYGWGNPVNSTLFGDAAEYIWESFSEAVALAHNEAIITEEYADRSVLSSWRGTAI
jgi:Exostosin family